VPYTPGLPDRNPLDYPAQPFEPTSTLVLTSPAKTFVDVRVLKPVGKGEDGSELPNEGGPRERLEWAFAGLSGSVVVEDPFTVSDHVHRCFWLPGFAYSRFVGAMDCWERAL